MTSSSLDRTRKECHSNDFKIARSYSKMTSLHHPQSAVLLEIKYVYVLYALHIQTTRLERMINVARLSYPVPYTHCTHLFTYDQAVSITKRQNIRHERPFCPSSIDIDKHHHHGRTSHSIMEDHQGDTQLWRSCWGNALSTVSLQLTMNWEFSIQYCGHNIK